MTKQFVLGISKIMRGSLDLTNKLELLNNK